MREYQQKHMLRTLVYSRVTLVVLFLLIVLLLRSIMELNTKRMDVAKLRDDSVKEREELQRKVDKAQAQTDLISTQRGFEAYIRTTYPVVKKGEGVIVIYDDNKVPVSTVREKMTVWEHLNIWWKNFFDF
jgi:translation initiation factor 2B subunit (eIF-2B alpha/beta/delta family)